MLTLRQIEVIRAVMVTGTISGAARLLNVAAPGEPISLARSAEIAHAQLQRAPRWLMKFMLRRMWNSGFSAIPPEALPYMVGSYTMNTRRLEKFLGPEYRQVMQHDVEAALADSFVKSSS